VIFIGKITKRKYERMRSAIGFLIVLYGLSVFFETAFPALDSAARETFNSLEMAALVSQSKLQDEL
jgi:hypothetical protein